MKMILVFTGKNQDEALAPIAQLTDRWTVLKARHPKNLGFENALRRSGKISGRALSGKLYFGIVEDDLVIDRLSAKMQVPEIVTAFDASVIDHFDNDSDAQKRLGDVWKDHSNEWDQVSNGRERLPRHQALPLRRQFKEDSERLWTELFTGLLSEIDLWDEEG